MRSKKIESHILEVLAGGLSINDQANTVQIVDRLNRQDYLKVNEVLETLGGRWNKKAKAHLFEGVEDLRERIEGVVNLGAFVNPKKAYDLFETPLPLAQKLMRNFDVLADGSVMLEPSAGNGNLVSVILNSGNFKVRAVEIQTNCAIELHRRFRAEVELCRLEVRQDDFMHTTFDRKFSGCLMNPPFSRQQDIDHVGRAIDLMSKEDGCTLVAVMAAGVLFRQNAKTVAFRRLLQELDAKIEENPDGTFMPSGTAVNTVTVTVRW